MQRVGAIWTEKNIAYTYANHGRTWTQRPTARGETLARHEKALLELAKRERLNITQIHREIVSGDTIAARPVMQQLLQEVQAGQWAGVLVMEVERLARGETIS